MTRDDVTLNQAAWDGVSDEYQREHGAQLGVEEIVWGGWSIPEDTLGVLGDVSGRDVLELGCGAAQFSIKLAKLGARCVGLDVSKRQLEYARRLMHDSGVDFPLIHAGAEEVPLAAESFDIVFCDHGGMTWADPVRTIPEASRLLRSRGLLAFNMSSPLVHVCTAAETGATERLLHPYFDLHRREEAWGVEFQLPYGEWIRLLRANSFEIENLIELRPPEGATTTYEGWVPIEWARRWPSENIWVARKRG